MFEKPTSTHVLGLDIDAFSLKGAAISLVRGRLNIGETFDFPMESSHEENSHVKPLYTPDQQTHLHALAEKNLVATVAETQEILVRPLELKLTKDKDIDAALLFQTEPLLPYPIENAIIDKVLVSKDKEGSKLTIFSIRKDHLADHIDKWNSLNINPEVISAPPQSLALFANRFIGKDTPFFVVHIGIVNSFGILLDQKKLLAAQAISTGLERLSEALAQDKGLDKAAAYSEILQLSFPLAPQKETPALKAACDEMRMTVMRTLYSLAKQFKGREVQELAVTGPGATVDGLAKTLCSQLNKDFVPLKEETGGNFEENRNTLLTYALPIGAALNAIPKCQDPVNFRQQEFAYPQPWKRLKYPIALYFLLCFGIAVSLLLFGKAYVSYQEGEIRQQYLSLLSYINKPYVAFEKEFAEKKSAGRHEILIPPSELTLEEIQNRLTYLEKGIQSTPQIYPLLPNVPLVSDVLAWISSHPNFVGNKTEVPGQPSPSMQIKSFNYSMVKRPDPTKKQEKYQVKVEMEFSSPAPKMAREFHDALIAPNDMVDPKGEIKWNSNRDLYRTSFYLKDRTVYSTL